jgi:hypothetical protein
MSRPLAVLSNTHARVAHGFEGRGGTGWLMALKAEAGPVGWLQLLQGIVSAGQGVVAARSFVDALPPESVRFNGDYGEVCNTSI